MTQFCALVANVKQARDDDRATLHPPVDDALAFVNAFFEKGIEEEAVFRGGDEVRGLYRDPLTAFLCYRMLGFLLGFDALRVGLGIGDDSSGSLRRGGSAYRHARCAAAAARGGRRFDAVVRSGYLFDDMLTTLADHSLGICKMRTAVQNETAFAVELQRPLVPSWWEGRSSSAEERLPPLALSALGGREDGRGVIARALEGGSTGALLLSGRPVVIGRIPGEAAEFSLLEGDLVGVSYDLAEIACSARQGIDRHVSQGRVAQERNAVALLALSLGQLF